MSTSIFVQYFLLILILNVIWTKEFGKKHGKHETLFKIGNLTATSNCRRECTHGEHSRNCYFQFNVEHYSAMGIACGNCEAGVFEDCFKPQCITANGLERGVTVVNRQLTGPSIQVCRNDVIIVDVINKLQGLTVSIHWHGILQRGTPYMDGVPGVTQCAVLPGTSFRYVFHTPDPGTYFWHSHSGLGRTSGIYGDLIIREPKDGNPYSHLYNHDKYEHVVVLSDWSIETPEMFIPGLPRRRPGNTPTGFLVNGKGKAVINATTGERNSVPYEIFKVKFGNSYRFRIINAGSYLCPIQIQIFKHNMVVIETDGSECVAQECDTLITYAGERFSIILRADQPPGLYWIRIRGVNACERIIVPDQFAILAYEGALPAESKPKQEILPNTPEPAYTDIWPSNIVVNPTPCISSENSICVTDLRALYLDQEVVSRTTPDLRLFLNFGFYEPEIAEFFALNRYDHFFVPQGNINIGHVNSISFAHPPSPLLSPPNKSTCSGNNLPKVCNGEPICFCPHVIKIPRNAIVEIVLNDTNLNPIVSHPFHLHGFGFFVVDREIDPTDFAVDAPKTIFPGPLKDTVNIPPGGYVVLRFRADNPGQWFFHCHFEYHMSVGMAAVLQVGVPKDLPPTPPGFPKCGDFLPAFMFIDES